MRNMWGIEGIGNLFMMRTSFIALGFSAAICLTLHSARAQQGSFLSGSGEGPPIVATLSAPAVQKELNLTAPQVAKVKALADEMQSEIDDSRGEVFGNPQELLTLPPDQRAARFKEIRTRLEAFGLKL